MNWRGGVTLSLFPVTYSLLSTPALRSHIQRNYKLDPLLRLTYFLRGMNDTYLVETETEKYIFRIYRADRRNRSEINFELDLLHHLSKNGLSVSLPVNRCDHTFINEFQVMEGTRYGILFRYADGMEQSIHAVEDSYRFGESIGHLHRVGDHFESEHTRGELNVEYLIDSPLKIIRSHMEHREADYMFLAELAIQLKELLAKHLDKGLDWGVCHGDLHGNTNVAFAENGSMTHYDFDLCGYGWRAYDIAEFRLAREIHSGHDIDEVERLWDAFLSGYMKVRTLSKNDLEAVPMFVTIRQLWLFGLCFRDSKFIGIADFDDRFIDSKMQYFKRIEIANRAEENI